ncbi:ester cyclase [Pseudoroseicyclus aestuarii]|uniref:SnoaL-like polyketide cyclase n=1 Tax=Pseudoroseicyclus aestuarii TaxID=1795041 RepID=A0A318SYS5_9RHOB|nr:ester cyclase [Pseudoroseicyclus aestuarii]PYE85546.1 SnoaL-like polyketide cyclase [Pseudoroseicyclus aestuarii]
MRDAMAGQDKAEGPMGEAAQQARPQALGAAPEAKVLQSERRDFTDLVPTDRPRAQSMQGFDDCYTDIVDYIVRCTHKIWDERDVGLIYTHYTHNCVLYGTMGALYTREEVVRDTIQRLVSFPERRGMATQVVWGGDDREGFYTSHLVTGSGRYTQNGHFGPASGRPFVSRTIADCMIYQNKIYREWVVADQMAIVKQLGLDPQAWAERIATAKLSQGVNSLDIGETGAMLGQYPPAEEADLSLASTDLERRVLDWMHQVYNRKMFGRIRAEYAPTAQYHGPLMKELYGVTSVMHQTIGLVGSLPDAQFAPQHICSTPCDEGGTKVAVRWIMEGHHLGYGGIESFGDPTGKRVQVMGITHLHYKDGRIVDDWTVYDELSMLVQVKMAQLADRPSALAE